MLPLIFSDWFKLCLMRTNIKYLLKQKILKMQNHLETICSWDTLLTLSHRTLSKNLKKRQLLSPYWFAAQQQASTFGRQKLDPFYLKFRAELNEFIPRVQKQQKRALKLLKPRCRGKAYAVRLLGSKG